jgi:hypothetical protein
MEIRYLGKKAIALKGKKETILVNEDFTKAKINSRVSVYTDHNSVSPIFVDQGIVIAGAGEYEVGGVDINGWVDGSGGTLYTITIDGIEVMVLDSIDKELDDKKIEKIDGVDVLVVSIDKLNGISGKNYLNLAKKLGANYLLPIGFTKGDEKINKFLDDVDEEGLEYLDCLKVDKDDLPNNLEIKLIKNEGCN